MQYTDCTTVQGSSAGLQAEDGPSDSKTSEAQNRELEQTPGKVGGVGQGFWKKGRMEKERGISSSGIRASQRSLTENLTRCLREGIF